jgi:hypothetical protein
MGSLLKRLFSIRSLLFERFSCGDHTADALLLAGFKTAGLAALVCDAVGPARALKRLDWSWLYGDQLAVRDRC